MKLNTHAGFYGPPADPRLAAIQTPLNLQVWSTSLQGHPDKDYAQYILRGLEFGFQIGVDETRSFRSSPRNMQSATDNPGVVTTYISKETASGNILGPFTQDMASKVHISRFGTVPKKHQPGQFRLITDLSSPDGFSVNDAISPDDCSLSYISVDTVAQAAITLGKGSLIAKVDIKSAYRLIPVCPYDRKWLGMRWDDKIFVDGMLPFGLRSAPKIFNAVADALEWMVAREGVEHIYHYLDDFAVIGPPDSPCCQQALDVLVAKFAALGVPLAMEKLDGPTPVITFLGIEIDTIKQELRLPEDKLTRLLSLVSEWRCRKACTRRELESLIGTLQHASRVIRPGRSFMSRALALLKGAKRTRHSNIRLNKEFRSDLLWWHAFASHWNGASLVIHDRSPQFTLTSDASGHWGCGAWHESAWFQLAWDEASTHLGIAPKELVPIIIGAVVWGHTWTGGRVLARCDNAAVVAVINKRSCHDTHLMQMLRCLFFLEALHQFHITAMHLPGVENVLADRLSRNCLTAFKGHSDLFDADPTPIPPSILQWLLHPQMDWTSPSWMQLFTSFAPKV